MKINEESWLLLLEQVSKLVDRYQKIPTETFKEKFIHHYKLDLLHNLLNTLTSTEWLENVESVLFQNWQLIKNSPLCYTAMPEDDVTLLLCETADLISIEKNKPALSILMPGLSLESVMDGYRDLNEKLVPIKEVIRTHITSDCAQYLVPVRVLADMSLTTSCNERFNNPYYDYNLGERNVFIEDETCHRLLSHSSMVIELYRTKSDYHQILADDQSLYGQLIKLSQLLYLNGTEGKGSEENAGTDAYPAILSFNEYYTQLEEEKINTLPEVLKNEIEKLLRLSSDEKLNINATEEMETCISTRRKLIVEAMLGHEKQLMEMGLSQEKQKDLLIEQSDKFNKCKELFQKVLQENYRGTDKYPLNKELFNRFKVVPKVTNEEELNDLLSFDAEELTMIFSEKDELIEEVAIQFKTIEQLVIFFINTPNDKLEIVLSRMAEKIYEKKLITNYEDLTCCLITLGTEKLKVVAQCLFNHLESSGFSFHSENFEAILKLLAPPQRAVLFDVIRLLVNMDTFIKKASDLRFIRYLSLNDCTNIIEGMQSRWSQIIVNSYHVDCILKELSREHQALVINAIKSKISFITDIKRYGDLFFIKYFSLDDSKDILKNIESRWSQVIKCGLDLFFLLKEFSCEHQALVIDAVKAEINLVTLVKEHKDLFFMQYLTSDDSTNFLGEMKSHWSQVIENGYNLFFLLEELSCEQQAMVINAIKAEISFIEFVEKGEHLFFINYLSSNDFNEILKDMKSRWSHVITDGSELSWLFERLSCTQRLLVINSIKAEVNLIKFVNKVDHLLFIHYLDLNNLNDLLKDMKSYWSQVIKNGSDLYWLLEKISYDYQILVINSIKAEINLATLVKKHNDLFCIRYFSLNDVNDILNDMKSRWLELIKSGFDLFLFLKEFSCGYQVLVINAIKAESVLAELIQTHHDLFFIQYLQLSDFILFLDFFRDEWCNTFETIEEFNHLLLTLSSEKRRLIFSEIKDNPAMAKMFKNFRNLDEWLDTFSLNEQVLIQDAINNLSIDNINNPCFLPSYRLNREINERAETSSDSEQVQAPHLPRP